MISIVSEVLISEHILAILATFSPVGRENGRGNCRGEQQTGVGTGRYRDYPEVVLLQIFEELGETGDLRQL